MHAVEFLHKPRRQTVQLFLDRRESISAFNLKLNPVDERIEQLFDQTYHSGRRIERLLKLNQID